MELRLQPLRREAALPWHGIKALGAAAHGTSPKRERADSCLSLQLLLGNPTQIPSKSSQEAAAPLGTVSLLGLGEAGGTEGISSQKRVHYKEIKSIFPLQMSLI